MSESKSRIRYRILAKEFETDRTASFVLAPNEPLKYRAGQFITFLFDGLAAQQVRRSYSISSIPDVDKNLRVTVQKIPNGLVSRHLVDSVKPGHSLTGLRPKGQFVLPRQRIRTHEPVVLIGGGSGFTPLFSILGDLLHHHREARVVLILANSTPDQILFRKQLFKMVRDFSGRLMARLVISAPTPAFRSACQTYPNIEFHHGRITNALIEQWIRLDCGMEMMQKPLFYVCGPVGLKLKVIPVIRMLGYPEERLFEEEFIIKEPFRPDASRFRDVSVKLNFQGKDHHFTVPAGKTILEAALENGIELPYNCQSGICTTCNGKCTSGKAVMYGQDTVTDTAMTGGDILTCVAFPLTEHIELVVDE